MNYELKLPREAFVNKFIAKTKFYEKATLSSKLQKEFVDKIQKITWKYKLAESTVGITKTATVTEIQIFEIELKEQIIPKKVLQVIDKTIPYQILYCFVFNKSVAYGITLKENTSVESYYFSNWNEDMLFDFTGIDLERVYQKLVKAFIRNKAKTKSSFQEIVDVDNKIKALEAEIARLESKISQEKQFNRKVEINKVLLERKKELDIILNHKL
ncbi:MAG: DUF4391 domain-containing protein [Proteobacteria bacterium]|nr:DUF4391 domain-containing protein [Desulfobacteraceae bacterium]MBU4014241.1 DUF4391 domain-containing protein [Pseudomonadota bacterium]MBU4069239.1 DUF4391 domain-containing protein [Pseudomonadota bacterium]MBU4126235.1 DUF4391 domain-containing protein [Pseudomonadota bacterium]